MSDLYYYGACNVCYWRGQQQSTREQAWTDGKEHLTTHRVPSVTYFETTHGACTCTDAAKGREHHLTCPARPMLGFTPSMRQS